MDLLAKELVADPHPFFHELRAREPVCWSERHQAWLVLRYDDVLRGFRDPAFSSEHVDAFLTGEGGASARVLSNWMEFRDPPSHTRLRKLAQKAFTPRIAEKLRPRIQAIVHAQLDGLEREGGGDFVAQFAFPLPAIVIAEMLGVPPGDRDLFKGWSEDIKGIVFGSPEAGRRARARDGFANLERYFRDLLEHYRRAPEHNLLSAIAAARDAGDGLTADEVVATCVLLLFGGHETTTNLLSTGLLALWRWPEQRTRLAADPGLCRAAVEEFLRYDGPLKLLVRWTREDRVLSGAKIRAGDRVFLVQAAANRDPARFPEPDRLDLGRHDNAHVAFGHGIHFCLGAPLARIEAEVAFNTILARLPGLRVETEAPEYQPTILSRALARLPVRVS